MSKYQVIVRFPPPSSSSDFEVDWYDIEANSEKEAHKKARKKASERIGVITTSIDGGERTNQYFD